MDLLLLRLTPGPFTRPFPAVEDRRPAFPLRGRKVPVRMRLLLNRGYPLSHSTGSRREGFRRFGAATCRRSGARCLFLRCGALARPTARCGLRNRPRSCQKQGVPRGDHDDHRISARTQEWSTSRTPAGKARTEPRRPDLAENVDGGQLRNPRLLDRGADMTIPGMLWGRIKRSSPHAHARIVSINTEKARAHPGVRAVITRADFPDITPERAHIGAAPHNLHDLSLKLHGEEQSSLYEGHPVAAVAATSQWIAEQGRSA